MLIIDEFDWLDSNDLTAYTYTKIKHLIALKKLWVVPIKEIIKILNTWDPQAIHDWFITYST